VLSSDGRTVQFQTQAGTVGYPLVNVESVVMPVPVELGQAQQALQSGDTKKALQLNRAVAEKYKGLPTDWAKLAASTAANLLISTGELEKADAAFREMERIYPGAGGLQSRVGQARIAVAKKDYATAKGSLESVIDEALKQKNVPRENAFAYSQAFYAMGLVQESEGKLQEALESYLRTVTIFFHDPSARSAAQQRANELREKNKGKKTSEHLAVP
jgi:tetratricopeptide (TPR) repeat protein